MAKVEVKPFSIKGRTGKYGPMGHGLVEFVFEDGEVVIARLTNDFKSKNNGKTTCENPPQIDWETTPPRCVGIKLEEIEPFSSRGLNCMYERGDHFYGIGKVYMAIFMDQCGELFARFWSRNRRIEGKSFFIAGISSISIPERGPSGTSSDSWIPKVIRIHYESWVHSEIKRPR